MISKFPSIKILDFEKISFREKEQARKLFGEFSLKAQQEYIKGMSRREKIKLMIEKSTNLDEINKLEILLKSGEFSEDLLNQQLLKFTPF